MSDRDLEPLDPELQQLLGADREIPRVSDEVRDRLRRRVDATVSGAATPFWRRRVAVAAIAALAAAAVLALWLGDRPGPGVRGAATVESRRTIALGDRGTAIAEAGAELSWEIAASGSARIEQRGGSVLYRVEPGSDFLVTTPHGTIQTLGTTFRVQLEPTQLEPTQLEPTMSSTMKRTAIGAAAAAAVVVSVYAGRVLVASPEGELEIGPGQSAFLSAGSAPVEGATAGAPEPARPPEIAVAYGDDPRGDLRLEGQVIDSDELPVAGAVVTVSSRPARTTRTEADGSFAFDGLVPRAYSLTARLGGSVAGPVTARLTDRSEPVILRVQPGANLEVEVVDAASREPIAGAEISAELLSRREATAGDDGVARLTGLPPGIHQVRAVAPGYAPSSRQLDLASGGSAERTTIALERGAALAGVVLGPDGKPVAGARVTARSASTSILSGGAPEEVTSGPDGAWRFPALARGSYELAARHRGHAPGPAVLETLDGESERRGVELTLARGARLSGRVVAASGEPAAHAVVRVAPKGQVSRAEIRQVHADRTGAFTLEGLPREPLIAFAQHLLGASDPVELDLSAKNEGRIELELRHEGVIAGVVVDSDGEPVGEAQVTASPADVFDPMARWLLAGNDAAITDPGGRFQLSGLAAGRYRVQALRPSRAGLHRIGLLAGGELAEAGDRDVRLVLPEDGAVTGKVVLASGDPPEAFSVSIGAGTPVPFHGTEGEFRVGGVAPGRHAIHIEGPGLLAHHETRVEVEPAKTADAGTIVVAVGRTVRGRVVNAAGEPVSGATVALGPFLVGDGQRLGEAEHRTGKVGVTGPDGRFVIGGAGNLELALAADHPEAGRSAIEKVPAGADDLSRELVLVAPGAMEGTVTRGGDPVEAMITAKPLGGPRAQYMVQTTADGRYRFDRLPPGEYVLAAKKMGGMIVITAGTGDPVAHARARVRSGETTKADVEIPGGVTVQVNVVGASGEPRSALVHLIRGSVEAKSGEDLTRALDGMDEGAVRQAPLIMVGDGRALPATFDNVEPGRYTACALEMPSIEDMGGSGGQISLETDGSEHVECDSLAVGPAPDRQLVELRFE